MNEEPNAIVRRLDELNERLTRLRALAGRPRQAFDEDPYLRDIVERNLEVAAQCILDIAHRIVALENARKPLDYYETLLILAEIGVLPADEARRLAPLAGFRNVLVHEYLAVNWDYVFEYLHKLDELTRFADTIRKWLDRSTHPS